MRILSFVKLIKPDALKAGNKVATICDSWGGAGALPFRFQAGIRQILQEFGLVAVPMANTLRDADWLAANPQARAADMMQAFLDPTVKAIFSVIGGEDSVRLLPFIDLNMIRQNPKIFIGFSDSTVSHFVMLTAGLTSFYGPSILAGFAENSGMFPSDEFSSCEFIFRCADRADRTKPGGLDR